MSSLQPSALSPEPSHWSAISAGVAVALIVASVAWVYWPGVFGFWGRDDYFQLAMVRLIGSPWPLFVHDHFPVPGAVFRPLGFASMWLGEQLFGSDYAKHAISDLVLHAAVALALLGVLRFAKIEWIPAALCTLLFALHPAVLGAALWWSARFDLLATLFVLLALQAALAYRQGGGAIVLWAAIGAALAALLSKEIGLVAVAAPMLVWLHWAWVELARRARALRAVGVIAAIALVYFGWRWCVLGTASSGLTGTMSVGSAIAKGLLDWLREAPGYFSFWTRLDFPQRIVIALAGALAVGASIVATRSRSRVRSRIGIGSQSDLLTCGLCLVLLPALLQSPVAALNAAPLDAQASVIEAAMQSRLYYLGIAGAAMLLAVLLAKVWPRAHRGARGLITLALAVVVAVFGWQSRDDARAFASRSVAIASVAREAVAAVAQLDLPAARCHVGFLGITPAPEWSVYVSMDSVIKALSPDLDSVAHCWFHADWVTYFYLQRAPVDQADADPYRPLAVDGKILPWRRLGGVVIAYLQPAATSDMPEQDATLWLRYHDGVFEPIDDGNRATGGR